MLEPLAIGKWTLKAEVNDESRTSSRSGRTGVSRAWGSSRIRAAAAAAVTATIYQRAGAGRSRNIAGIRD